jgi:lipopolysaccharide export system protein LptA
MNGLGSRRIDRPSPGQGQKGRRLLEALCVFLFALLPAPLRGIEGSDIAPFAKESLDKRFQTDGWSRSAPVDIRSEEMSVDFEKHQIVFKGDVRVQQADFSLTAGEVTAVFGKSADDIRKIVATEGVRIQKADKTAWGEQAVYDRQEATIVLTGNPVLKQGRNFIKGEEIRVRLDEDRMEVKGSVEAEFLLSEKQEGADPETSDGISEEPDP